jgi:uncharacterized protein
MPTIEQARSWYEKADTVHDFDHVLRVYRVAERLAEIEGADIEIVHAAALLHDSKGTTPGGEERAEHHIASADFAGTVLSEEGWDPQRIAAVQLAIRAHRFRGKEDFPQTIEAKVIFDADKLDVLGAIGVARVIGYAAMAGEPLYAEPSEQFKKTGIKLPGEPHSAYHEYLFKLVKIKSRLFTNAARAMAEERTRYLDDYFKRLMQEISGDL